MYIHIYINTYLHAYICVAYRCNHYGITVPSTSMPNTRIFLFGPSHKAQKFFCLFSPLKGVFFLNNNNNNINNNNGVKNLVAIPILCKLSIFQFCSSTQRLLQGQFSRPPIERWMAYFLGGQTEESECNFTILPSWYNFRAQELRISGTATGHLLFKFASYCLLVKKCRG